MDAAYCSETRPDATGYALLIWNKDGSTSVRTSGERPERGAGSLRELAYRIFWKDFNASHKD